MNETCMNLMMLLSQNELGFMENMSEWDFVQCSTLQKYCVAVNTM